MSRFTPEEIAYMQSQRLGRLATVNKKGDLHVVPVGFRYNPDHDTIDIGGHNIVPTKKYREALRHGRVAFVVDDVLPPWKPRFIEVRGTAQAEPSGGKEINPHFAPDILRITPTYIVSMGVNDDVVQPGQQRVNYYSRKVEKKRQGTSFQSSFSPSRTMRALAASNSSYSALLAAGSSQARSGLPERFLSQNVAQAIKV